MSKVALVLDMPKNCSECILCSSQDGEYFCIPDDFNHYLGSSYVSYDFTDRPDWCPLKEVPKKYEGWYLSDRARGYNACIDEILGDKE